MKKVLAMVLALAMALAMSAGAEHEYIEAINDYTGVWVFNAWEEDSGRTLLLMSLNKDGTAYIGMMRGGKGTDNAMLGYGGSWKDKDVKCLLWDAKIRGVWMDEKGGAWLDCDLMQYGKLITSISMALVNTQR